jgi:phage gp36-like protein
MRANKHDAAFICGALFGARPVHRCVTVGADGEPDAARIAIALSSATGIIVAHLPWLLDKETGEIALPLPAQFADALKAICADIAIDRLSDAVTGSENTRNTYKESLSLLERIDREYQGGLSGPGLLESCVVEANALEGIDDQRFFKKGGMW